MTHATGEPPQDAPLDQPWPGEPQPSPGFTFPSSGGQPAGPDPAPGVGASAVPAPPQGAPATSGGCSAARPVPTGPNWGLAVVGLLLVLAAGVQLAYLLGYRPDADVRFGPQALIALGAALLLVGAVGSLTRHSCAASQRRRHASRGR